MDIGYAYYNVALESVEDGHRVIVCRLHLVPAQAAYDAADAAIGIYRDECIAGGHEPMPIVESHVWRDGDTWTFSEGLHYRIIIRHRIGR